MDKHTRLKLLGITPDVEAQWAEARDRLDTGPRIKVTSTGDGEVTYRLTVVARDDEAPPASNEILIWGPIVPGIEAAIFDDLGDDLLVSAKTFREQLSAIDGDVTIRINSPGGDVAEASAIMAAILERRESGDSVDMVVDGLAASAASMILLAGEDITMAPLAQVMIHRARGLVYGTETDFRAMAGVLAKVDEQQAGLYATKTEMELSAVYEALDEERWFTAAEAVEAGLADRVMELEPGKEDTEDGAAEAIRSRNLRLMALLGDAA